MSADKASLTSQTIYKTEQFDELERGNRSGVDVRCLHLILLLALETTLCWKLLAILLVTASTTLARIIKILPGKPAGYCIVLV